MPLLSFSFLGGFLYSTCQLSKSAFCCAHSAVQLIYWVFKDCFLGGGGAVSSSLVVTDVSVTVRVFFKYLVVCDCVLCIWAIERRRCCV